MTFEPPKGLKANLKGTWAQVITKEGLLGLGLANPNPNPNPNLHPHPKTQPLTLTR